MILDGIPYQTANAQFDTIGNSDLIYFFRLYISSIYFSVT